MIVWLLAISGAFSFGFMVGAVVVLREFDPLHHWPWQG